jgi:glycosyltransferase involved in cell wall biosynthesis
MRVFMNFSEVPGPYGGANSFLRTLRKALGERGVEVTNDERSTFDVALLNALTDDLDLALVRRVADRAPVIHRKVGYRVSGSPEMRRVVDGIVWGDRVQLEFTPYLAHTIFQSAYSRAVFAAGGFDGPSTVIHNGVDENIFNLEQRVGLFRRRRARRRFWNGREPLRVIISTWSTDENKGFSDYREIDRQLGSVADVRLSLVGRVPEGTQFHSIAVHRPVARHRLADTLRQAHVLLQLARFETCSNALIEGINCGLPAIYLDSGSNGEIAGAYGVTYEGDFVDAVGRARDVYDDVVRRIPSNPYRIGLAVDQYLRVLQEVSGA